MKLSSLAGETATTVVKVGNEENDKVTVIYRPGALTLEVADQLREVQEGGFQVEAVLFLLKPMLVSWDLQDEDGSALPVDEQTIKKIPLNFLGMLVEQIVTDVRPSGEEGKGSGDSLRLVDGSVTPPTGSPSSEQPSSTDANRGSFSPNP